MHHVALSCIALLLLAPVAAHAGDARGTAAFLFAYYPRAGQKEKFEAGYREHLEWHRAHRDPLPWYAWYVFTGERTGLFVDGSFGVPFAAFDERVEPAQDAANFAATTAPYAETAWYEVLRWMPVLGTSTRLADRAPSAQVEVVTYLVRPGRTAAFESCLEALARVVQGSAEFAVYRRLSGGAGPAYRVMFPRAGYGDLDEGPASIEALIRTRLEAERQGELLDLLAESVQSAESETWVYRGDLSYFPE
jgi:hypothetical protein